MSIESAKTLSNAEEGFKLVNVRDDFAFIHDVNEIKYEMARNCNFSLVGDNFGEQPYSIGKNVCDFYLFIFISIFFHLFFVASHSARLHFAGNLLSFLLKSQIIKVNIILFFCRAKRTI
jgi:hypothetical protein